MDSSATVGVFVLSRNCFEEVPKCFKKSPKTPFFARFLKNFDQPFWNILVNLFEFFYVNRFDFPSSPESLERDPDLQNFPRNKPKKRFRDFSGNLDQNLRFLARITPQN